MAWIERRKRGDGGVSAHVRWRLGGGRGGAVQIETFSAGSNEQNLGRAEGFKKMVEAAGGYWPDGWVKGEGFVRARCEDRYAAPPTFLEVGEEYVRQIVDLSPGQRKRYLVGVVWPGHRRPASQRRWAGAGCGPSGCGDLGVRGGRSTS